MMSKEKRRVPKLRFPGFTEDWEQRKLGDYLTIPEKEILEVASVNDLITVKLNLGGVESGASRDTLSLGSTVYYKRYAGQFIYGKQNFFNGSMGLIPKNLDGKGSSGDVPSFNVSNIEANYLYTYVSRESYWRLKVAAASGTGSKRIHEKTFLDFNIDVPSLDEQKLISNTFDLVNRFITLHQRKLNNLKLKKKALLQKLFPKNGERYPELRFSGFTDAWEQCKLTDIAKTFIGLVTTMTENYRDSGTLLIRNSDIKEGQFIFSEKPIHLDEEFAEKNKTRRLQIGDVVTVHTGDIGTSAVIEEKEDGAIGFATINTRTDQRILNPYFLSTYFNTEKHKCYANSVSTGDGRSNYNIKDFNKLVISIPTLDEQERISLLINNINTIITLHQRKLDHLQLQKKALLQQMFV